jgi:predicted AlkP superfamily pyrophosphatase or phosphodiesterase
MFLKETQVHPFGSAADLWVGVRQLCEAQPYQPMYIWVYWEGVDHLSHHHGPDSEQPAADFSAFSAAFERLFLERLRPALRQDTLVILMADHGQLATPPDSHYLLGSHPGLARRLHITPTGENRLMYLYVRPGQLEAVREYIQRAWLGQFTTVDSAYAAHSGLFGPGEAHPRLLDRLGDLIVFPGESGYIWWAEKENFLLGRHGGLNPQEMLVPFLAARLGG